jgi:NADPH-dependent curcumin reductase CurA
VSAVNPQANPGVNRQIVLAEHPVGMPRESDFRIVNSPTPKAGSGEVLVRTLYLSVDPYMRGRMTGQNTYARGLEQGEVMVGAVVGRVVESNDPRIAVGDIVEGMLGWQEYAVSHAKPLRKIDPSVAPITTALYVLGIPGLTAYFGLLDICRPQPGETVVVTVFVAVAARPGAGWLPRSSPMAVCLAFAGAVTPRGMSASPPSAGVAVALAAGIVVT